MRHGYAAAMPGSNVKILALHLLAGQGPGVLLIWLIGVVGADSVE